MFARTRVEGRGGQPHVDNGEQGGQKLLKMCGHPLWIAPNYKKTKDLLEKSNSVKWRVF